MSLLELVCSAPQDGKNTVKVDTERYGRSSINFKYIYRCRQGFKTNDSVESICMSTGEWSIHPPNCSGMMIVS